jgi:hypothetical protein
MKNLILRLRIYLAGKQMDLAEAARKTAQRDSRNATDAYMHWKEEWLRLIFKQRVALYGTENMDGAADPQTAI